MSGVSKSHVSYIEIDTNPVPKPDTLRKLAPSLGVTYEHLMYMAGYYNDVTQDEIHIQLDLDNKTLLERTTVLYDGVPLTEHELKSILAFLKALREMND